MSEGRSRLFSWLSTFDDAQKVGRLEAIFICPAAGERAQSLQEVAVIADAGLAGDRYAENRGHWRSVDGCQITLVSRDEIAAAEKQCGLSLQSGEHRRNLVISGLNLKAMQRRRIAIGELEFAYHRLRPPCAYLDRVETPGLAKSLKNRGGIGIKALRSGVIAVGDHVRILSYE